MAVISRLEAQKRNPERVNVYLDGEYAFSLTLMEAAKLQTGQTLTDADVDALMGGDTLQRAVDSAARFLSFRPRSMAEVRRNLKDKDFPPEVIEAAIGRLAGMGYLDDAAFAAFWVQNRSTFKPLSRRAMRYELAQHGVANDVIDEALEAEDEGDLAYRAALKHIARWKPMPRQDFKQKLSGFLQRRGFGYNTVRSVLNRLDEELVEKEFFTSNVQQDED